MVGRPESLLLAQLRRLDERQERIEQLLVEVLERMTALESADTNARAVRASDAAVAAGLQASVDRLRGDVGRIKRRLDLGEG